MSRSIILTSVACAALLCAGTIASAQNSSPGSNGNNLDTTSKSPNVDPASSPSTAGQDKSHGNDMVSPNGTSNGGMKQADASRPDFSTLDTKNKGSVIATSAGPGRGSEFTVRLPRDAAGGQ
jgi:hypothetical protein